MTFILHVLFWCRSNLFFNTVHLEAADMEEVDLAVLLRIDTEVAVVHLLQEDTARITNLVAGMKSRVRYLQEKEFVIEMYAATDRMLEYTQKEVRSRILSNENLTFLLSMI